jgi:hypothetical protein
MQIVSMLEAPLAIIALSGPPINQIVRRVKNFGFHSLFSTARYPTPVVHSDSEKSGSLRSESKGSIFSKVIRKKSSSTGSADVPPVPSMDEGTFVTVPENGTGIWTGSARNDNVGIHVRNDVTVA